MSLQVGKWLKTLNEMEAADDITDAQVKLLLGSDGAESFSRQHLTRLDIFSETVFEITILSTFASTLPP